MPIFSPMMMRSIIIDHYETPRNKRTPLDLENYEYMHLNSTSCIDDITLFIKLKDGVIEEVLFDGIGCTISIASTSILTTLITGLKPSEAHAIIKEYKNMLDQKPYNAELLDEAIVFMNTSKQPSRIRCALIGWDGADKILKEAQTKGDR